METIVDGDAWVSHFHPARPGSPRLVCLPHAGGSASFYFPVSAALHPDIEVLAVQYPGRQNRRLEEPVRDIHTLADRVAAALRPWCTQPLAFFGHSMGAVVAYEVALRLQRAPGAAAPAVLFASGRRAPSAWREETVHQRDDDGMVRELRRLAGTESELLADEEVLRMIMPALRADYEAIETYAPRSQGQLDCPVTALIGDSDPRVTIDEARAWQGHTTGGFEMRTFSGGHFYLTAHQDEIIAMLRDRLIGMSDSPTG